MIHHRDFLKKKQLNTARKDIMNYIRTAEIELINLSKTLKQPTLKTSLKILKTARKDGKLLTSY